jgi:hypothetical protein
MVLIASYTLIEMSIVLQVAGASTEQIHYYLNGLVLVCYIFTKIIIFLVKRYIIIEEDIKDER